MSGVIFDHDDWKVEASIGTKHRFNDWLNSTFALDIETPEFFNTQAFVNLCTERKVPHFRASYDRRDNAYMGMKEKEDKFDASINVQINEDFNLGVKVQKIDGNLTQLQPAFVYNNEDEYTLWARSNVMK